MPTLAQWLLVKRSNGRPRHPGAAAGGTRDPFSSSVKTEVLRELPPKIKMDILESSWRSPSEPSASPIFAFGNPASAPNHRFAVSRMTSDGLTKRHCTLAHPTYPLCGDKPQSQCLIAWKRATNSSTVPHKRVLPTSFAVAGQMRSNSWNATSSLVGPCENG